MPAGGETNADQPSPSLRDVHRIVYDGPGPGPKIIQSSLVNSQAWDTPELEEGMLLHAIDGMSVHGSGITVDFAESLMEGTPGLPFKLLVSRPEIKMEKHSQPTKKLGAAAPKAPVDVPEPVIVEKIVEQVVEKIVYIEKPVEKIVEKVVEKIVVKESGASAPVEIEKIVYLERPVEKIIYLDRVVEVPTEVPGKVPDPIIREVPKEVIREVPVEVIRQVPVEVIREVIKEVIVEKEVEKKVEVPVEKIHEIIIHPMSNFQPPPQFSTIQTVKSPSTMSFSPAPLYSTQQYPNNLPQYPQNWYGSQQYPQSSMSNMGPSPYGTQQYPQTFMSNMSPAPMSGSSYH